MLEDQGPLVVADKLPHASSLFPSKETDNDNGFFPASNGLKVEGIGWFFSLQHFPLPPFGSTAATL